MHTIGQTYYGRTYYGYTYYDEVERRVAAQLVATCEEALRPLPPSAGLAIAAAKEAAGAREERERAAARVLLGERHALEACRDHWLGRLEAMSS